MAAAPCGVRLTLPVRQGVGASERSIDFKLSPPLGNTPLARLDFVEVDRAPTEEIKPLLARNLDRALQVHRVSRAVNQAKIKSAECIEPVNPL